MTIKLHLQILLPDCYLAEYLPVFQICELHCCCIVSESAA